MVRGGWFESLGSVEERDTAGALGGAGVALYSTASQGTLESFVNDVWDYVYVSHYWYMATA